LLIGILLGLTVGIFNILYNNFRKPYVLKTSNENGVTKLKLELSENLTFLNKASIIETVSHLPDNSEITIDASRSEFIHPDIMEILEDFKKNAEFRNIRLEFLGMDKEHENPVKEFRKVTKKD
ncbi:MAG: SulP family inorganic anion transporter, partial [Bacteroidota bacterium]